MDSHMILYRGSLKSCNYHCSYCPFSKKPLSEKELGKDREQWKAFVETFQAHGRRMGIGALMVVPYGEALIHSWYWEGLARISALPWIEAVGAQTNFSFPVEKSLGIFGTAGGIREKLRLWATFHPEMTTILEFADKCRQIRDRGISLSVGAVGVPGNIELLQKLRKELPKETYLWLNRMDGLERPYTKEEIEACLEIDSYFLRELTPPPAEVTSCKGRLFVEGDGRLRLCNIGQVLDERWEGICRRAEESPAGLQEKEKQGKDFAYGNFNHFNHWDFAPNPECKRRRCTCYLAYGGREEEWNRMLFGHYPLFRIPRRPKAVFLDIEGTLIPQKEEVLTVNNESGNCLARSKRGEIPAAVLAGLEGLFRDGSFLFFATTLPFEDGIRRCKKACRFFSGGVFAGGAHIVLERNGEKKERYFFLDGSVLRVLEPFEKKFACRLLTCQKGGRVYKATLFRSIHKPWERQEIEGVLAALRDTAGNKVRCFAEGNCLQIIDAKADKAKGVLVLCEWLGIAPEETYAIGDSEEDAGMVKFCGKERRTGEGCNGFV